MSNPWGSGLVTSPGIPPVPPSPPPAPPRPDGPRRRRRQMLVFGGVAGGILLLGLTIILILVLTSNGNPFGNKVTGPTNVKPPLAQACPPPATPPSNGPVAPSSLPPVTGPRTVDSTAGISYKAFGSPWEPWGEVWRAGTLEVPYRVGQHFVTETYPGGLYHASILSAAVPATDNDAITVDLECVGHQVAADARASYYPQPNTMDSLRDEMTTLGGRQAWLTEFRLHFNEPGLQAKDELAAIAIIDVGKPSAAVLYISIPGNYRQYDYVVDEVLASVRPV